MRNAYGEDLANARIMFEGTQFRLFSGYYVCFCVFNALKTMKAENSYVFLFIFEKTTKKVMFSSVLSVRPVHLAVPCRPLQAA